MRALAATSTPSTSPKDVTTEDETIVKSRLVARGDQEEGKEENRSDAPTASEEAEHLVLS